MKSHIFFLLLCVSLILTGCPYEHSRVTVAIKNESTDTIVVACGFDKYEKEYTLNCDTILHNNRDLYDIHIVEPNGIAHVLGIHENELQDTFVVFFINKQVYDMFPWDAIANNNMITSRYDVPIQYYVSHHSAKEPLIYPYKEDNKEIHIWQTRGIEIE